MTPVARRNRTRHRRGFNGAVAQHHGRRVEYSNSVLRSTMLQWDHGSTPRTTSVHQAGRVASRYPFNGTVAQHQGRPRLRGPCLLTISISFNGTVAQHHGRRRVSPTSIGNSRRFNGTVAEHHGRRKGCFKSDGVDGHASFNEAVLNSTEDVRRRKRHCRNNLLRYLREVPLRDPHSMRRAPPGVLELGNFPIVKELSHAGALRRRRVIRLYDTARNTGIASRKLDRLYSARAINPNPQCLPEPIVRGPGIFALELNRNVR